MSMPLIPPYAITASYQNSQFGSGNLYVPGVPSVLHHLVTPPTSASDAEAHSDAHGVAHGFTPYSAANEVQLVTISGSPTSGTFLLGWGNAATSPIAYNASSATVQTALRALVSMPLTAAGINDVQTVTITGGPTGGTFTLTFGGQTTSALAFNASPAAVQTALQALSTSGAGATYSVAVSGSTGGPYTVTFSGGLGNKDVQMLWADGGALRGGTNPNVTVTTSTQGKAAFVNRALLNTTRQYDGMKNFYDSASGNNLSTAP
jgi:hypothetical protein